MTIEEFEKNISQLNEEDMIRFINENSEIAIQWVEMEVGKNNQMQIEVDEEIIKEMWYNILKEIRRR